MKDYLATHIFKSEEMKKKFHEVVGSTSPEDLKKELQVIRLYVI